MEENRKTLAVVMQRRCLRDRWDSVAWEPWSVMVSDQARGEPRTLVDQSELGQWMHFGYELALRKADADGYYLNVSTADPKVFVLWRDEEGRGVPSQLTASYSEASSWMDAGEQVDSVPMPTELVQWLRAFVERHYRPQPKKRVRPQSFRSPKDRAGTA